MAAAEIEPSFRCRICGGGEAARFAAREMMYGTRERFDYVECAACGCVQIATIPAELGRFYPRDYYSYRVASFSLRRAIRGAALRVVFAAAKLNSSLRERLIARSEWMARLFLYEDATQHNRDAAILDVGTGGGDLVRDLADLGYRHALGIDPFLSAPVHYRDRLVVAPLELAQVAESYDVISFHHSLEHMQDQQVVLRQARERLRDGGYVIVRIPVVGGEAWETYRADWVQLDPPRHLYLHSLKSIGVAAEQAGLKIAKLDFDSTSLQFWGSELYRRDIPLTDPRSPAQGAHDIFSADEIAAFAERARRLNAARRGDQIVAFLTAA